MAIVSMSYAMQIAKEQKICLPAFIVENINMVQAVTKAAEELSVPVILQINHSGLKELSLATFYAVAAAEAKAVKTPVVIHLDHGNGFSMVMQAVQQGFGSVMIDGSHLPLEENIALSKKAVEACAPCKVWVEAELGRVNGKEGDLDAGDNNPYTDAEEAAVFCQQSGANALAVAIGNAHGFYKGEPHLDLEQLAKIQAAVGDVPLVLHGTSGIPADQLKEAIRIGIRKANYATDLRVAYVGALRTYLAEHPECTDQKECGKAARQAVEQKAKEILTLCAKH